MDTSLKAGMSPSLALLTLKRLTPEGHTVRIINENNHRIDWDWPAELVGVTVTVDVFARASEIAARFRAKGVKVVAGGIHATACPESFATSFDAVCVGRAEASWAAMLRDAEAGALKPVYRDDFSNPAICPPDYSGAGADSLFTNVVCASRGCPMRCGFCHNSSPGAVPLINRPVAEVLGDLRAIGGRHFLFIDDNFIGDPRWTEKFLRAVVPLKLKWGAAVSANILDMPGLMDLMAESGCQSLFIGFETLNQSALDAVGKHQNRAARFAELARELHGRGIMVNASVVFGLPGDDAGVFKRTLDWLVANKIETATAHIMTPYPGTPLHARMRAEGRITETDLSHYDTAHVVFTPENMGADELMAGYLWFYKELYSFRNILRRFPAHRRQRAAYVCFNLFYRKFGRVTAVFSRMIPRRVIGKFAAWVSYRVF